MIEQVIGNTCYIFGIVKMKFDNDSKDVFALSVIVIMQPLRAYL